MNEPPVPPPDEPQPPLVIPVRYVQPPQPPPRPRSGFGFGGFLRTLLVLFLALSLGLNLVFLVLFSGGGLGNIDDGSGPASERYYAGDTKSSTKVAVIKLDGIIMEGTTAFMLKQIEAAATDSHVKGVVVRVVSPGGSITASDEVYRRLKQLAKGEHPHQKPEKTPKTVVVSMGAVAASGGYYVAMPAEYLYAERTTITGSIGVYASFPSIAGLAKQYGVGMNVIKAGAMKDSGSMFKDMSAQEHHLWQGMVNNAYNQFLAVVEEGRPDLKGKLTEVVVKEMIPVDEAVEVKSPPEKREPADPDAGKVEFVRRRADGGIWTAEEAKKLGLIDEVGYLDDAIGKVRELAKLPENCRVVTYERPVTLANLFLGAKSSPPAAQLDLSRLASGATPRVWYLAPQSDLAGLLAAVGQ